METPGGDPVQAASELAAVFNTGWARRVLVEACRELGSPEPERCAAPLARAVAREARLNPSTVMRGATWMALEEGGYTVEEDLVPPGCRGEARELAELLSRPGGDAAAAGVTGEAELYNGTVVVYADDYFVRVYIKPLGLDVAIDPDAGLAAGVSIDVRSRVYFDAAAGRPGFYATLARLVKDALRAAAGR